MPNRDPSNKNISIPIPNKLRRRIDIFINRINFLDELKRKMTLRKFLVQSGNEYIKNHGG